MKLITSINGKIVKRGQDKISVFDNALLYAEGLFETCLGIDGRIIFFNEHLNRLYKGAKVTGFKIPVKKEILKKWVLNTSSKHPSRITKIRITVTAGEAARWVGQQGESQIIISVAPHQMPDYPFKLYLSDLKVDQDSIFRQVKTISYAIHASALREAINKNCNDALLLNEKNQIAEVTSANIFWVNKNKIYTPPLNSGCLEGITRKIVFRESKKLGYKLSEKNITLPNLVNADEIFISSSLKLIAPVSEIKRQRQKHKISSGAISNKFKSHFYKLVKY